MTASGQTHTRLGRAEFLEDLEWLLRTGETNPETIAARLGISFQALDRRLHRAGRADLLARMTDVLGRRKEDVL